MSWPQGGAVLLGTDSLPGPLPSVQKTGIKQRSCCCGGDDDDDDNDDDDEQR